MDKKERIIEYLKEKYDPSGIILHGSRVAGKDRPHSDWDVYLLFADDLKRISPQETVYGEHLNPGIINIPVAKENILKKFGSNLIHAEVLFDPKGVAQELVVEAKKIYAEGRKPQEWEYEDKKAIMLRCLGRMEDYIDDKEIFFLRLGKDFYPRALDYWYLVFRNEWSKSAYDAIPEIKELDAEYFGWLEIISSGATNQEKLETAKKIYQRLFGN